MMTTAAQQIDMLLCRA